MSRVLRTVAVVASAAALVATGVGAFAVAGSALAATAGSVATFATLAAGVASVGAQVTAPKPTARGSITQTIIAAEPPRPCIHGETFFAGVVRHQVGYGPTLKKVPNPYLWQVKVFSGVGPVNALVQEQFDFEPIGSYYNGFYSSVSQLGLRPESAALVPPLNAPATGWGANHKLSGCAAIGSNYLFDRDGERFASGLPLHGAIWQGVGCYDPRLDSTRPGGSGPCRLNDQTTWPYTTNPALHAGTYAYGWYENGIRFYGLGVPDDGIDWAAIAAWANDCDTNDWEISGVTFEGGSEQSRVRNLDDIGASGGGRWLTAGAVLSFDWHRPRVPLATIRDADILEVGGEIITLQTLRDRMNTVRPQFTDPDSKWELVTANAIVGSTYLTEDQEPLIGTWPLNMVKDAGQAGELASYALVDSREIGPITLTLGPEWRFYKPGDCLRIESVFLNFNSDLVILNRKFDPQQLQVTFTFKGETPAKHDFALGKVAVPPPTPVIGQTAQQRDSIASFISNPRGIYTFLSSTPAVRAEGGQGQITVQTFTGTLDDSRSISVTGETQTGLDEFASYDVVYDLIDETLSYILAPADTEIASSRYAYIGRVFTSDGVDFPDMPTPPPGWGGGEPGTEVP